MSADQVVDKLKAFAHQLTNTQVLLLRWPEIINDPPSAADLQTAVAEWVGHIASRLTESRILLKHVGAVVFGIGHPPSIVWNQTANSDGTVALPAPPDESALLHRALVAEFYAMLDWGHAVWRPKRYHYQLPSGDHAGIFVRVGDALRTPRDVRALSTWLTSRLRDGMSIVADSATLLPLVTDLSALVVSRGWELTGVEMLDEYPRTRFDITRAARKQLKARGGTLGLLSVSASGTYRQLMIDSLASSSRPGEENWSLVVLVQKGGGADETFSPSASGAGTERTSIWLGVSDQGLNPLDAATCQWCKDNTRAQVVRIDPRTFEALALPGHYLLTPNVTAARQSVKFWDHCAETHAVDVEVQPAESPSIVARPEKHRMGVAIRVARLMTKPNEFIERLGKRMDALETEAAETARLAGKDYRSPFEYEALDGVVVSKYDAELPNFEQVFAYLKERLGLSAELQPTIAALDGDDLPEEASKWRNALVLSVGSVTGWNLRQLHLAIEKRWKDLPQRNVSALVLHARPSTHREWETLGRSFRNNLAAVWLTYLPWRSPIEEEARHLAEASAILGGLTPEVVDFYRERVHFCNPRSSSDTLSERVEAFQAGDAEHDPLSILWGASGSRGGACEVRTHSNFGYQVDCLTAYTAIGAAMQSSRQRVDIQDPRWRVFEFPAITRAYYDGILVASILRWCEPQEAWWGDTDREAENVMSELVARTQDKKDQAVLFPELFLAASQGKIPDAATVRLADLIDPVIDNWSVHERAPIELGIALWKNSMLERIAPQDN
ncbi:hypothetical protein AU184_25945 [Mycolicibacterium novocastrense]|nr:hypothetical protein AU072_18350 [Mycolicibacterium novocastrense]KUH71185.1 hypothetical protein AU183_20275 [Mycolicibacterium novocastrense]KUH73298.1 hypothetical protein AU184_25945 [Mycolicibacterium novocastrense]